MRQWCLGSSASHVWESYAAVCSKQMYAGCCVKRQPLQQLVLTGYEHYSIVSAMRITKVLCAMQIQLSL